MHIVSNELTSALGVSGVETYTGGVCDKIPDSYGEAHMAKFNIEEAMEIARSGDEERLRHLFQGLAARLNRKPYGLVWEEGGDEDSGFEMEPVHREYREKIPYPKYRQDLSLNTNKANGNMLLEGDNYIWLNVLAETHAGTIDAIVIDPPYNTGSDFKYGDHRVGKDDMFRHSMWLDFMHKRLELAKELMSTHGVMFITIDDNEFGPLLLLCHQMFGQENVDVMIWRKSGVGRDGKMKNTTTFRKDHDYVIVCFKEECRLNKIKEKPHFVNEYPNPDKDPRGCYMSGSISRKEAASNPNSDKYYTVVSPSGREFTRQFDVPKEEFDRLNNDILINEDGEKVSRIYWGKNGDSAPRVKVFMDEPRSITPYSLLLEKGTTTEGTKQVSDLLHIDATSMRPKPVLLFKTLVQLSTDENSIVLDFFAGTGTTAHAVEELNAEDGGHRQWILITNNEDEEEDDGDPETGICRDITKPRIDTIITGVRTDGTQYSDGYDSGYQYFQYDFIKRDRRLYERNAGRFFKPYIVDALIPIKHGVARTIQDGKNMLCVYEGDAKKIIAIFKDPTLEDVHNAIEEHFADDDREHLLILPEGASLYKAIIKELVKSGVDVQYQHNLISTAGYLE